MLKRMCPTIYRIPPFQVKENAHRKASAFSLLCTCIKITIQNIFFPKLICHLQICCLADWGAVCIAAPTGKNHSLVMESHIIDKCQLIIWHCLLKCPKKVIGGCHQRRTVFDPRLFISSKSRIFIFFHNAIKFFQLCGCNPIICLYVIYGNADRWLD